jgi:hypothetical protein
MQTQQRALGCGGRPAYGPIKKNAYILGDCDYWITNDSEHEIRRNTGWTKNGREVDEIGVDREDKGYLSSGTESYSKIDARSCGDVDEYGYG